MTAKTMKTRVAVYDTQWREPAVPHRGRLGRRFQITVSIGTVCGGFRMFRISTQGVWALCDAKSRRGPTWISLSFGSEPTVHTNKPKKPLKMSKTDQTYIMVK
jgi:hypothetical protein